MSEQDARELRDRFDAEHQAPDRAWRIPVPPEGARRQQRDAPADREMKGSPADRDREGGSS